MSQAPSRGFVWAAGIAVVTHLLLFVGVRPTSAIAPDAPSPPPVTRYLFQTLETQLPSSGSDVRTVRSPVIFSLPSGMGFSRELQEDDVRTSLSSHSKKKPSERFLEVDPSARNADERLDSQGLMLSAGKHVAPQLPSGVFQTLEKRSDTRRIMMVPELQERLVGGVVLPAELNVEVSTPWEVRASVSVSEAGMVQHVFLDRPLESVPLNQQVLQLLHGLRFELGSPVEGTIEIYSAEAASEGGLEK